MRNNYFLCWILVQLNWSGFLQVEEKQLNSHYFEKIPTISERKQHILTYIHTRCLCHLPSTSLHHTSSLPLTVRPVWKQSESRRVQQLILTDLVRAVVSGEGASRLPNAVAGTHQQQRGQKGEPNVSEGVRKSDPIPTDENYPPVKGFLVQHVDWILQHLQNTLKHTSLSTSANSSTSK